MTNTFTPGDWADHRSGQLDPREVAEVSKNGDLIRLTLFGSRTDWLPAANYENIGPR